MVCVDSERDVDFRLRLADGFLGEARDDVTRARWRSCVDNAQLAVENAVKAVIARFVPVPRTHDLVTLPWELFDAADAQRAMTVAERSVTLARSILGRAGR